MVRHAEPQRDAAACASIYAPNVVPGPASFEEEAPESGAMAERIATASKSYPWLVSERDGRVAGFAYGSAHRSRAAYRWAVDVTVYVDPQIHRGGVGRELYEALLELLARQRLHIACAGIALPNDASVGLHEALGFDLVGVYRDIGFKGGEWRDVGWWQKRLLPADAPPEEPLPPQRLR
jgi:L-amino acid N-acyltransferase YncA